MGFGLLTLGYVFTFILSLTSFGYIPRLIGYIIIIVALEKLHYYEKTFRYTQLAIIPLICVSLYQGVTDILIRIGEISVGVVSESTALITNSAFLMLFHVLLLLSIYYIGKDTELVKIKNASIRNLIIMSVYACLFVFMRLPISLTEKYMRYFSINALILQLIWTVLNIILMLSCAKNICPEGEEDIPIKKSKFGFVNNFRDKLEQKEQKSKQEMYAYRKHKLEQRQNKLKNRRK